MVISPRFFIGGMGLSFPLYKALILNAGHNLMRSYHSLLVYQRKGTIRKPQALT